MKNIFRFLTLLTFASCSNNSSPKDAANTAVKKKHAVHTDKPQVPKNIDYALVDSTIRVQIKRLDSLYGRTPYYTVIQNKKMFIVLKGKFNPDSSYYLPKFTGRFKYGIAGEDLKIILPCEYDKIYNPNLTVLNCMEIKKGNEIGLYNFITKEILKPQFEYICPSSTTPDLFAYGFKNGDWYKIDVENKFSTNKADFSPIELLKTLTFDVQQVKENLFYGSYSEQAFTDMTEGAGVVVTPSYIENLDLMPEICDDLILPEQKQSVGIENRNIKTDEERSVGDKISSFFVSFYEQGVEGRPWNSTSGKLVVYNKDKKVFFSQYLNVDHDDNDNVCQTRGYKFLNDTLIEIVDNTQKDTLKKRRYDYENNYSYKSILADGEIKNLLSNRYYNFTKHIEINESYFEGCYADYMDDKEVSDEGNMWVSEHLTLEDLSLMVNEIYAEYGFKFKTEKWSKYFSQFSWYDPQYDNVDDKLSVIDKKNIALINKEKEKLKGKENDYIKRHKATFYAAG